MRSASTSASNSLFQRGGSTKEASIETIRALADAGIDLIEISGGTYEAPAMSGAMQDPKTASTATRDAYLRAFAEKVRAAVTVPLMVTGGFRTAAGMNAAFALRCAWIWSWERAPYIQPLTLKENDHDIQSTADHQDRRGDFHGPCRLRRSRSDAG